MQALFNVSVTINNVVAKFMAPNTISTLTCGAIRCFTAIDSWRATLRVRASA